MARRSAETPAARAHRAVERDLCVLTGAKLAKKYGDPSKPGYLTFCEVTGSTPAEVSATHNPFFYYAMCVWFDNKDGRLLIHPPRHRDELADILLRTALGEHDTFDGVHIQYPRRALKSTFLQAFADWLPKFHKLTQKLDITVLYTHNSEREATRRVSLIKEKNRRHPFIAKNFPEFVIPTGEWGTKAEYDWPCRAEATSVAEASMTAMSAAAKKAGRGYNYKLLDDWEDEDSRYSDVIREELSANYDQLRALKAVPFSREVSAGTPYNINGLYRPMIEGKRSDGSARYKTLKTPALTDDNEPLFPTIPALTVDGLAKERANEIERTGSDIFWYLQYQLEPRLTGTQAMEWEWWRPMSVAEYRAKWAKLPKLRCVYVDSAWKGDEKQAGGDATAIQVIDTYVIGSRMERILLDQVISREMTSDEGADTICRLMKKWGTRYYSIEQAGEKTFEGVMKVVSRSHRMYPTYIDLKGWTKKKKMHRISAVAGAARMGLVHYLEGLPHIEILRSEVSDYPENKRSPNALDCFANSFAEVVTFQWVPVALEEQGFKEFDVVEDDYQPVMATRYTGIPVYH